MSDQIPKTMKAVQISGVQEPFKVAEVPVPTASEREILIKVEACGICHGDAEARHGGYPGVTYPVIPGHEVVGRVVYLGSKVPSHLFSPGMRVGVGWQIIQCTECGSCLAGKGENCLKSFLKGTGITQNGGYAQYMVADWTAVCQVPEDAKPEEIAPLLCAGSTVFNALREVVKKATPGSLVAIQGIGGLGHLAIQFSRRLGFKTVAISSGNSKRQLSHDLGAHIYIDSSATPDVAGELQKLGGAIAIIATAPNSAAVSALVGGLVFGGSVYLVAGIPDNLSVNGIGMLIAKRGIEGILAGNAQDRRDTINFSLVNGVKTIIETYSLEEAELAFGRVMSGEARFRPVLLPWKL